MNCCERALFYIIVSFFCRDSLSIFKVAPRWLKHFNRNMESLLFGNIEVNFPPTLHPRETLKCIY